MKKQLLLLLMIPFLTACNPAVSESTNKESSTPQESTNVYDSYEESWFVYVEDIEINVGEVIEIDNVLDLDKYQVVIEDTSIAALDEKYLGGVKEGETSLYIIKGQEKQTVKLKVTSLGEYVDPYKFSELNLKDKKMVVFGDSVTAIATIGQANANLTYSALFAKNFEMNLVKNYAIGGTTATHTYFGSNIYKEYAGNKSVLDGCQVVQKAYKAKELNDIDMAFIAYGHNDQYFQPPVGALNDRSYSFNSFASCKSYKGSYRYMINTLRAANPDMKIVLMNCTYSKYNEANPSPYGSLYNYNDYREATKQIAIEMNCKYIDPWDYMETYYDFGNGNVYYKDSVHISVAGHKVLADYLIKQ